jgi:vanillate O-demethylase monooxygenase subunit
MAAWSEEITSSPVSRRLNGEKLVFFREEDGAVAALDDRCPHRFAPLSLGNLSDGVLTCGYHGLRFDGSGACVHNPFSDRIPSGASVRSYPAVERHGMVWYWPGDLVAADGGLIPDYSFLEENGSRRTIRGYTVLEANYEYGTDNLMDLSHIEFVHKGSFAGDGVIFKGEHRVEQDGDTLHSNWWMPGIPAPKQTTGIYPPDLITDHWLEMRWNAPATMYLEIGTTPHGTPRQDGFITHQAHILTPETESRTHYFWATTRDQDIDDPAVDEMLRSLFGQAFNEEDKPMIKAAYDNIEGADFWACKPLFLGVDAGGTKARRLLESIRKREQDRAPA